MDTLIDLLSSGSKEETLREFLANNELASRVYHGETTYEAEIQKMLEGGGLGELLQNILSGDIEAIAQSYVEDMADILVTYAQLLKNFGVEVDSTKNSKILTTLDSLYSIGLSTIDPIIYRTSKKAVPDILSSLIGLGAGAPIVKRIIKEVQRPIISKTIDSTLLNYARETDQYLQGLYKEFGSFR